MNTVNTSITSLVSSYNSTSVKSFNTVLTREEKKLSKAFIYLSINIFRLIESRIKEDENLKAYREEYNSAIKDNGLKGSNYGFSNILKIGKLEQLGKLSWLLEFSSFSALSIALGAIETVPSCNGIKSLDILPANKSLTIDQTIEKLDSSDKSIEIREKVNAIKGLPVKLKAEADKAEAEKIESRPVDNSIEKTALQLAKTIASYRNDESFLLAFSARCYNLGIANTLIASLSESVKNRISLKD